MDIDERFLPIGTVVLLKGGKKELMIIFKAKLIELKNLNLISYLMMVEMMK